MLFQHLSYVICSNMCKVTLIQAILTQGPEGLHTGCLVSIVHIFSFNYRAFRKPNPGVLKCH